MIYSIRADLHNHLKSGSYMSTGIFNKAIDRARNRLGKYGIMGLVNFSDHRYEDFSELKGYEREDKGNAIYIPEKEILVVKGQEIPTKQGHLLVLGLEKGKYLQENRTVEDTIKEAKDNNGIIIADHPFYIAGIGIYLSRNTHLIGDIDALEVFNGEAVWIPGLTPRNSNKKAEEFYTRCLECNPKIAGISSSDGHSLYEIGNCSTNIRCLPEYKEINDSEDLIKNIRKSLQVYDPLFSPVNRASRIGAIDHIVDLALVTKVSKKFDKYL